MKPLTGLGLGLLLGVAACGKAPQDDTAIPQESAAVVDPQALKTDAPRASEMVTATIDWASARSDLAASNEDSGATVQVQSGGNAPPVPVLLPSGIAVAQSDGAGVRFNPTRDGYFAAYPGAAYDIVMNGTNQVAGVDGEPVSPRTEAPVFTATVAGAQVALSRYGADYLIEFECNQLDAGTATCIDEVEALAVAERLVVAGSR
ncbi:MAG: hypothetical protein AAGK23_06970 [Pseudomonadota bacterium]